MNKWAALSQPTVMDSGGKAECWSRWGMEEGPACQGPATVPRQSRQSGDGKSSAPKSIMCHLRAGPWWRGDAVPESQHVTDLGFQSRWHNFIRKNKLNNSTSFLYLYIHIFFLDSWGKGKRRASEFPKFVVASGRWTSCLSQMTRPCFHIGVATKGISMEAFYQWQRQCTPHPLHLIGCNAGFLYSHDTYAYFFAANIVPF